QGQIAIRNTKGALRRHTGADAAKQQRLSAIARLPRSRFFSGEVAAEPPCRAEWKRHRVCSGTLRTGTTDYAGMPRGVWWRKAPRIVPWSPFNQPLLPLVDDDVGDDGRACRLQLATYPAIVRRQLLDFVPARLRGHQRLQFFLPFLKGFLCSH